MTSMLLGLALLLFSPAARSQTVFEAPVSLEAVRVPGVPFEPPAPTLSIEASAETGKEGEPPTLGALRGELASLKSRLEEAAEPDALSPGDIAVMGERRGRMTVNAQGEELSGKTPTLVRLHDAGEGRKPAVEIPMARPNGSRAILLMAPAPAPLRPAPERPLGEALRKLRLAVIPLVAFSKSETVRVRDENTGSIERMTYLGRYRPIRDLLRPPEERRLIVRDSEGGTWTAPRRTVFKDSGRGEPSTLALEPAPPYIWPKFDAKDGLVGAFLDGAAWLGSHPEFLAASDVERWKALASYVGAVMRPGMAAHRAEFLDLGFPELLALGHGVCRHSATLFVAALREAGYEAKLMLRNEKLDGHAWTEVRPPAGGEPWFFDVQNGKALSLSEARAEADADPESLSALWFLHPDRKEHPSSVPAPAP